MNLKLSGFTCRETAYREPLDFFEKYSRLYYSSLLTGRGAPDNSDFSYIGLYPNIIIRYRDGVFEIERETGVEKFEGDFWNTFHDLYDTVNFSDFAYPVNLCGPVGYISYEALHTIEKIESRTEKSYSMPVFEMVLYNRYIFFDNRQRRSYVIDLDFAEKGRISKKSGHQTEGQEVTGLEAECTREGYIDKVKRIKEYILEGDVYEVCLTQEFRADFHGDPFRLFRNLYTKNPAPYSAYLNFRDFTALCNSPELFIRCRDRRVETRPIKGTAPRGKTFSEDGLIREKLRTSEKEGAELAMIIDLLRNDIGKVCRTGTVKVLDSRRIEGYENVYQLIGVVEGELDEGMDYVDLLKAVFPGGSITGCPKVRSMEIIEELESYKRNLYTGTIFIGNKKMFQSNIVIRTAVISGGKIFINSGGAVTIDSVPEDEYSEVLLKVSNIMKAIGYGGDF